MENGSKALVMAASTLLAIMLFAIFTMFIKNIAVWPEAEDEMLSTEQRAKFNEEYQIYQKSAMYGVDVVSCLNKALSNNEKYVDGNSNFSGDRYDNKYYIDVTVEIHSNIQESIEVRAKNAYGKEVQVFDDAYVKKNNITILKLSDVFNITSQHLSYWDKETLLKYQMTSDAASLQPDKKYSLIGTGAEELKKLLTHSTYAKQIVKNKGINKDLSDNGWTQAIWTTYLYNFKQKRFKCTNIELNSETGLVNLIEFEEII